MAEYLEEETIDLRELGQAIWRRKWIVIAMFLASVVGAAIASQFMTPIYEAATTVMVQDSGGGGQLAFLDGMGAVVGKNKNQNYVEILKSRTLAMRTAQALGLDYDVHSSAFAGFRNNITVQLVQGTDAIRIKVQHPDPQQAQLTANTLVDTFMNLNQEVNTEDARSAREFIGEQLKIVEADLRKAEEELRRFKEQEKVVAPSEEARAVLNRLSSLESSKAEAQVALDQVHLRCHSQTVPGDPQATIHPATEARGSIDSVDTDDSVYSYFTLRHIQQKSLLPGFYSDRLLEYGMRASPLSRTPSIPQTKAALAAGPLCQPHEHCQLFAFHIIRIIQTTAAVIFQSCPCLFGIFRYIGSSVTHAPRLHNPLSRGLLQRPLFSARPHSSNNNHSPGARQHG
jgi:capsular polysaccharide biosynthesis protein